MVRGAYRLGAMCSTCRFFIHHRIKGDTSCLEFAHVLAIMRYHGDQKGKLAKYYNTNVEDFKLGCRAKSSQIIFTHISKPDWFQN